MSGRNLSVSLQKSNFQTPGEMPSNQALAGSKPSKYQQPCNSSMIYDPCEAVCSQLKTEIISLTAVQVKMCVWRNKIFNFVCIALERQNYQDIDSAGIGLEFMAGWKFLYGWIKKDTFIFIRAALRLDGRVML